MNGYSVLRKVLMGILLCIVLGVTPSFAQSTSVIPNGSFEDVSNGWPLYWSNPGSIVSLDTNSNGNHGTNSLHFAPSTYYVNAASLAYGIDNTKPYLVSFYLKTLAGSGDVGILIDEYDANWGYIQSLSYGGYGPNLNGVQTIPYSASSSNVHNVSVQLYTAGMVTFDAYFDSVSFAESVGTQPTNTPVPPATSTPVPTATNTLVPTATSTPAPTNTSAPTQPPATVEPPTATPSVVNSVIPNGSFELVSNGWPTDWSNPGEVFFLDTNSNGNHGSNSLRVAASDHYVRSASLAYPLDSSKTYLVSFYLRTLAGSGDVGIMVDEYDAAWNYIQSLQYGGYGPNLDGVQTIVFNASTPNVGNLSIQIYTAGMVTFDSYFDSVYVTEYTAPVATVTPVPTLTATSTSTPVPTSTLPPTFTNTPQPTFTPTMTPSPTATSTPSYNTSQGMDINGYCVSQGHQRSERTRDDAYSFACDHSGSQDWRPIDMRQVCGWQYEGLFPYVALQNPSNPGSWTCNNLPQLRPAYGYITKYGVYPNDFQSSSSSLSMDFNAYCVSQGHHSVERTRDDAYSFACDHNGAQDWRSIDTRLVCVWQYGTQNPYVSLGDINNPGSWSCQANPQPEPSAGYITYYGSPPAGANVNTPEPPPCPTGVGEPGDFSFMNLTQQQKNELYWAFGHSGEAPVGYFGETCSGGTLTLPSFNGGSGGGGSGGQNPDPSNPQLLAGGYYGPFAPGEYATVIVSGLNIRQGAGTSHAIVGWAVNGDTYKVITRNGTWGQLQNSSGTTLGWSYLSTGYASVFVVDTEEVSTANISIEHPFFPHTVTLNISEQNTVCYIENGAEIVAHEIVLFNNWMTNSAFTIDLDALIFYMAQNDSHIETLRHSIEATVNISMGNCTRILYRVGPYQMDTSGLGNIMYGYGTVAWWEFFETAAADIAQILNEQTQLELEQQCGGSIICYYSKLMWIRDFPDDQIQIDMGEYLAELTLYTQGVVLDSLDSLPPEIVIQAAEYVGLN